MNRSYVAKNMHLKFLVRLHVNTIYLFSFVETPRKFIIVKLSIRRLESSLQKNYYY